MENSKGAEFFPLEHGTIPDLLAKRTFKNIFVLLRMERSQKSEFQRIKAACKRKVWIRKYC